MAFVQIPRSWLTPELVQQISRTREAGRATLDCSLDLGLTTVRVEILPHALRLADGTEIPLATLDEILAAKRGVFIFENGRLRPVQITGEYFYKLIPTSGAPTLEISGIQMHRTTGTDPFQNALESARTVVRKNCRVFDTCGGLGYTAIAAARLGAAAVLSTEIDPNVLAIARDNPWSQEYFTKQAITIVESDAFDYAASQPDGSFRGVIHDPPRFSRAGRLYGAHFYAHLARILRPHGTLFHYTGQPYSRGRGRDFIGGIARRLREAGFAVRRAEALQALVARLR